MRRGPIRIGVAGAGVAALNAHIPAIAASPGAELIAICDRDPRRLAAARQRWPSPTYTESMSDLLDIAGLDAVVIATPPDSHLELARLALARHKHILIEKPLAPSLAACHEMLGLAQAAGIVARVGHEKRFHPTFQKIRSLLRAGVIGTPYYGGVHWASNVKLDPDHLVPAGFRGGYEWRWMDPAVGGGILQDHLPHYVDLIRDWMDAAPEAIYAHTFNLARDRLGWPADKSVWEDMGIAMVRFSNGFVLRFETGVVGRSLSPLWSQGSGVGEWTEYGYIFGTSGQLLFDLLPWDSSENGRIALWRLSAAVAEEAGWTLIEQPEPMRAVGSPAGAAHVMFTSQTQEWLRAIAGEPSRAADLEQGAICVAAVEAAYRSSVTRCECAIDRSRS